MKNQTQEDIIYYQHLNVGYENKITIAAKLVNNEYRIGWAKCSPKDNYCKKTGREIASTRLATTDLVITFDEVSSKIQIVNSLITLKTMEEFKKTLIFSDIRIKFILALAATKIYENDLSHSISK